MASRISTLNQLKALASAEGGVEVFVMLSDGIRIVKRLWYFPANDTQPEDQWDVYTELGDHYEEALDFETLRISTMIIEALNRGALYQYD
jgi:hypothetical protein